MGKQAKTHKAFRLDAGTIALIEQYAEQHGVTNTKALENLVSAGAKGSAAQEKQENTRRLEEHLADMRATADLLREQLAEKDKQIAEKDKQIAAKDTQLENITQVAAHAQELQAAEIKKQLPPENVIDAEETVEAVDVDPEPVETHEETQAGTQDAPQPRGGFFSRLFSRR